MDSSPLLYFRIVVAKRTYHGLAYQLMMLINIFFSRALSLSLFSLSFFLFPNDDIISFNGNTNSNTNNKIKISKIRASLGYLQVTLIFGASAGASAVAIVYIASDMSTVY